MSDKPSFEQGDLVVINVKEYKRWCANNYATYDIYSDWVGYAAVTADQHTKGYVKVDVLNTRHTIEVPIEMVKKVY